MNQQTMLGFDASIAALVRRNPALAFTSVPSSFTSYFGESLGWPDWLLKGTELAGQHPIPRELPLVEGLKPMARLLTRLGEAKLAEMMLEWSRFPLEAEAMAAPDLEAAVRTLVVRVDRKNPTVELTMTDENGALAIRIGVSSDLGAFCALYEQLTVTWMFLVIRSFLGLSSEGRELLSQIAIGRFHSDPAVDALLPCRTIKPQGAAMLVIPPEALRRVGPDFKPELWAGVRAALEAETNKVSTQGSDVVAAVTELVVRSLRDYGRAPPFAEISRSTSRSQRTLARAIAEARTSYREIVDTVRMKMAKEMLANSDASVRTISARLGYSDDTAFVRAFRRCYGMSPDRWRKAGS